MYFVNDIFIYSSYIARSYTETNTYVLTSSYKNTDVLTSSYK